MKRLLLSLALALFSACAAAQIVPLQPTDCSANRICNNVDGYGTTIYATTSFVEVILADGTAYFGSAPVGLAIVFFPVYRQPGNDAVIYVTASWMTWTTAGSGSGRGGYQRHVHWELASGSVLYP